MVRIFLIPHSTTTFTDLTKLLFPRGGGGFDDAREAHVDNFNNNYDDDGI
jgi:hypothetical protein